MTTIAEASVALERARERLAAAKFASENARTEERAAFEAERKAYREFNEAVAAVRPKRTTKARPQSEGSDAE